MAPAGFSLVRACSITSWTPSATLPVMFRASLTLDLAKLMASLSPGIQGSWERSGSLGRLGRVRFRGVPEPSPGILETKASIAGVKMLLASLFLLGIRLLIGLPGLRGFRSLMALVAFVVELVMRLLIELFRAVGLRPLIEFVRFEGLRLSRGLLSPKRGVLMPGIFGKTTWPPTDAWKKETRNQLFESSTVRNVL